VGHADTLSLSQGDAIDIVDSSEDDEPPVSNRKGGQSSRAVASKTTSKRKELSESDSDLEFQKPVKKGRASIKPDSPKAPTKKVSPRKATAKTKKEKDDYNDDDDEFDDDDFEEEDFELMDDFKPAVKKAATNGKGSKAVQVDKAEDKMDLDVKVEEPKETEAKPKFNWAEAQKRKAMGPAAPGSKEIPNGKANCLSGLTLVFTGELSSLSREDATDLAKRFGAKVTSAISSKTSYVVMGQDAGKSKIEKQKQLKTKMLDEDGFLNLIAERSAGPLKLDDATKKKMEEDQKKIEKAAKEMQASPSIASHENALWTVRYAPQNTKDLVGNGPSINKLREWLHDWPKSLACGFKKPGKNAMNIFRAVLISGPPGIGKTSAAHIIAKLEGYTPIELNASDVRSKKLIEASLSDTINNSSLDSWYKGGKVDKAMTSAGIKLADRTVLIMDEVDGMSGGDRGGVGAINALIKKTKVRQCSSERRRSWSADRR
jgi:replication factor C subunit 1